MCAAVNRSKAPLAYFIPNSEGSYRFITRPRASRRRRGRGWKGRHAQRLREKWQPNRSVLAYDSPTKQDEDIESGWACSAYKLSVCSMKFWLGGFVIGVWLGWVADANGWALLGSQQGWASHVFWGLMFDGRESGLFSSSQRGVVVEDGSRAVVKVWYKASGLYEMEWMLSCRGSDRIGSSANEWLEEGRGCLVIWLWGDLNGMNDK